MENIYRPSEGCGFDPRLGLRNHFQSIELEDRSSTLIYPSSHVSQTLNCWKIFTVDENVCKRSINFLQPYLTRLHATFKVLSTSQIVKFCHVLDFIVARYTHTWKLNFWTPKSSVAYIVWLWYRDSSNGPNNCIKNIRTDWHFYLLNSWKTSSSSVYKEDLDKKDMKTISKYHHTFVYVLPCSNYYTICCSLPKDMLSLTPTSKSLTQKYSHFIQF